jgi:hypothetical protein
MDHNVNRPTVKCGPCIKGDTPMRKPNKPIAVTALVKDKRFSIHNAICQKLGYLDDVVYRVGKRSLPLREIKARNLQLPLF